MGRGKKPEVNPYAVELLFRKKAATGLLAFAAYTHPSWTTGAVHRKICFYLDLLKDLAICPFCGRPIESLGVFAPPRHGKTELVSRRFPAYCMGKHPTWNMICAQATDMLASDTGADVRGIIKSPEFKRLFPEVKLREDAQAAGRWITSAGGIYYAAGVDGTIVGRGANVLDIDDPHKGRQAADSPRMRDIAGNWFFGDALTRLMPPARVLLTLTRWHEDDLGGRLIPPKAEWMETEDPQFFCAGDWHVLRLRAIEFEDTPHAQALWPERYDLEYLYKRRDAMRKAGRGREWEAQYQQNPVAEEGAYLKREWFNERYDELPNDTVFYLLTDFAVTDSLSARNPDRTEFVLVGLMPSDDVAIIDSKSFVSSSDVWIKELVSLIKKRRPACVFGESGVIRRALEPVIERELRDQNVAAYFEWMPQMANKLARGRSLQAWAASGRICFPKGAPWVNTFIDEITAVGGGGRFDDKFDALSHFFLAIDDNHPAVLRTAQNIVKKQDTWQPIQKTTRGRWR